MDEVDISKRHLGDPCSHPAQADGEGSGGRERPAATLCGEIAEAWGYSRRDGRRGVPIPKTPSIAKIVIYLLFYEKILG